MTTTHNDITIKIDKRTITGKQVKQLRRQGILPGVVYGHKIESYPVQMDRHSTALLMRSITPTTLVTLDLNGKKTKVIVRERNYDVVTGELLHLDFLAISMTEKLRASVAIELVGEAPVLDAVPGSLINHVLNEIEIEALPADMPERIEVNISKLEAAEDMITVGDLDLGEKITILTDESELVVSVAYVAEETEPIEGEGLSAEPEVMEKGKKEEAKD